MRRRTNDSAYIRTLRVENARGSVVSGVFSMGRDINWAFLNVLIFVSYVTRCVTTWKHGKLMGDQVCPRLPLCGILDTPLSVIILPLAPEDGRTSSAPNTAALLTFCDSRLWTSVSAGRFPPARSYAYTKVSCLVPRAGLGRQPVRRTRHHHEHWTTLPLFLLLHARTVIMFDHCVADQ